MIWPSMLLVLWIISSFEKKFNAQHWSKILSMMIRNRCFFWLKRIYKLEMFRPKSLIMWSSQLATFQVQMTLSFQDNKNLLAKSFTAIFSEILDSTREKEYLLWVDLIPQKMLLCNATNLALKKLQLQIGLRNSHSSGLQELKKRDLRKLKLCQAQKSSFQTEALKIMTSLSNALDIFMTSHLLMKQFAWKLPIFSTHHFTSK